MLSSTHKRGLRFGETTPRSPKLGCGLPTGIPHRIGTGARETLNLRGGVASSELGSGAAEPLQKQRNATDRSPGFACSRAPRRKDLSCGSLAFRRHLGRLRKAHRASVFVDPTFASHIFPKVRRKAVCVSCVRHKVGCVSHAPSYETQNPLRLAWLPESAVFKTQARPSIRRDHPTTSEAGWCATNRVPPELVLRHQRVLDGKGWMCPETRRWNSQKTQVPPLLQ